VQSKDQTYNRESANACPRVQIHLRNKHNLVLYIDKELVDKSKALGFNLSKTFENHLKHLITQFSTCNSVNNGNSPEKGMHNMGLPGFEPGSIEPKSTSLDQASRQPR
jgi:hypothetical protein